MNEYAVFAEQIAYSPSVAMRKILPQSQPTSADFMTVPPCNLMQSRVFPFSCLMVFGLLEVLLQPAALEQKVTFMMLGASDQPFEQKANYASLFPEAKDDFLVVLKLWSVL